MNLRDHALQVAVLTALTGEVQERLKAARRDATEAFKAARVNGHKQQAALLPDGDEIGLISIHGGATTATVDDEAALLDWVTEHAPHQLVDEVERGSWDSTEIVALIKEHFPNVVRTVVRHAYRERLIKQMEESGGHVHDPATGEAGPKLGTVHRGTPTGAFTYRPGRHATDLIVAEWQAGRLAGVDVGPLALAAPAPADPVAS